MNDVPVSEQALLNYLDHAFRAPRDVRLAVDYLRRRLPAGAILLAGAGSQTEALLPHLQARTDVQIIGIVDRRAAQLGRWKGYPVFRPDRLPESGWERVVVCHQDYEWDMVEDLKGAGLAEERIFPIYSSAMFAEWALPAAREALRGTLDGLEVEGLRKGPRRGLLVTGGRPIWSVLTDEDLVERFGVSLRAYFGRDSHFETSSALPTVDVGFSIPLLETLMEWFEPEFVYLRVSYQFNTQVLAVWLRRRYPAIRLVVEVYDWALSVTEELLKGWNLSRTGMEMMYAAERFIASECDLVVCKNGGRAWDEFTRGWRRRPLSVFPLVTGEFPADGGARPGTETWRILWAASLPTPEDVEKGGLWGGHRLEPVFESLGRRGVEIDIFNTSHDGETDDERFRGYAERFRQGPVRYHRRIPYPELLARMAGHHFGWMVVNCRAGGAPLIDRVTVPNRFGAFVAGGLPVIVEPGIEYLAELVERFHAGLVVPWDELDRLPELLDTVDYAACRQGILALRSHVRANNERVLARLAGPE